MEHKKIYIKKYSAWAPGIENNNEWEEWAQGKRDMVCSKESPGIKFTDPMFRRRISQISKMTIQVVHDLLPVHEDTKMLFVSLRGEINRQFTVNKELVEDGSISPAAFSFAVFNAPVALTSIALNLKGGYTAIYPSDNSITPGLSSAYAMLNTGHQDELIFIYADENVPEEYSQIIPNPAPPFSFSLLLSRKKQSSESICSLLNEELNYEFLQTNSKISPEDFLRKLILSR